MVTDIIDNLECDGQMSIYDYMKPEIPEELIGVSKIFARAKKQMSLPELKTLMYALANVRFKENMPPHIYIEKKVLAEILGIKCDYNHLSQNLWREIKDMWIHSAIEFVEEDKVLYANGAFISNVAIIKDKIRLTMSPDYATLFFNLETNYITMWSTDLFSMHSDRALLFYEDLRLHSDTRGENVRTYGVKALKDLFGMAKEDYVKKDGHFDRYNFEKRIIEPLIDDLKSCHMINLKETEPGQYYKKVKNGNRVLGYEFMWSVCDRPRMMSAEEKDKLAIELNKNPDVIKVAKDIVDGKKIKKQNKNKNNFGFKGRDIDFEELEKIW